MTKLDDLKKQVSSSEVKEEIIKPVEKKTSKPEPEPEKPVETKFTPEDKLRLVDRTIEGFEKKGIRLRRREKKLIENMEHDTGRNTQTMVISLTVIGLLFLVALKNFLPNEAMFAIVIIIGSMTFLPTGMLIGWIVLDPVMKCKILRKVSHRNYGIINFVGKGKKMISKIKNFDYGLIWKQNECWVLTKGSIYQLTKDGNAVNQGKEIDPESIITLVETVPVIHVDMDSMEPLVFTHEGRIPVYPMEIGSSLRAWVDNQRAKQLALRKTTDIFMMIAIGACIGAIVVSFLTMQKVEELMVLVGNLEERIASMI